MFKIISLFTFLFLAYNQGISQNVHVRDSIVQEQTSALLKKIITEVNDNFLCNQYLGNIKPGEITLDTNYVIANYHIMQQQSGREYALIQEKKIEILHNKGDKITSASSLVFEEDKLPMRQIPKLEIKISDGGTSVNIELYIYSENYWVLTENTTKISCGYYHIHKLHIYDNGDWGKVIDKQPVYPPSRL